MVRTGLLSFIAAFGLSIVYTQTTFDWTYAEAAGGFGGSAVWLHEEMFAFITNVLFSLSTTAVFAFTALYIYHASTSWLVKKTPD